MACAQVPAWRSRNPAFSPPDRRELHGYDAVMRAVHSKVPLGLQHWLRDSGTLRALVDGSLSLGVPLACLAKPSAGRRALATTRRMSQRCHYGPRADQAVECYDGGVGSPEEEEAPGDGYVAPAAVFVHGGAWGSGRPWMYRLLVDTLEELGFGAVYLVGYRTFPCGGIEEQLSDVAAAVALVAARAPHRSAVLLGHSSGAHLAILHCLRAALHARDGAASSSAAPPGAAAGGVVGVAGVVGLSGVYDLLRHHHFEAKRGAHILSPMAAACGDSGGGDDDNDDDCTRVGTGDGGCDAPRGVVYAPCGLRFGPAVEDGAVARALWRQSALRLAQKLAGPAAGQQARVPAAGLPHPLRCLVVHGALDTTVPLGQSVDLAHALGQSAGLEVETAWLPATDHQSFMPLMFPDEADVAVAAAEGAQEAEAGAVGGLGDGARLRFHLRRMAALCRRPRATSGATDHAASATDHAASATDHATSAGSPCGSGGSSVGPLPLLARL